MDVRSTPVLPHWHVKDPGHSAKSAGGRLHLNMHTPLTHPSRSGLTRHSVGTYQETSSHASRQETLKSQSSQLAEPLWTDPGLESEISVRELIPIKTKQKKRGRGMNRRTFSQNLRTQGKKPPQPEEF